MVCLYITINASVVHGIMNYKGMKAYSSVEVAVLCNCEEREDKKEVRVQELFIRSIHFVLTSHLESAPTKNFTSHHTPCTLPVAILPCWSIISSYIKSYCWTIQSFLRPHTLTEQTSVVPTISGEPQQCLAFRA